MAASPSPASRHDQYKLTGVKVSADQVLDTGPYTSDLELEYTGVKCIGKKIHQALFMQGEAATKVRQLKEQCHVLSQLRHPNIAIFLGLFFQESPILVIEHAPYNLASCIEHYGLLPNEVSFSILNDVALGLSYLHHLTSPIVHGELCANNVLLTSNMTAKISYLGVAKILQLTQPEINYMAKTNGTSVYMSPEARTGNHENQVCSASTDIYSFGIMVNHVMTGKWPQFESHSNKAILITVTFSEGIKYNDSNVIDTLVKELVFRCTSENPQLRPQVEELVIIFADMVSKFPPSFINRLEMLNRIKAHKKLQISERDEKVLQMKVKGLKQRVLAQRQEIDRLTVENQSLKQQIASDNDLICKTISDLQKSHAKLEQQLDTKAKGNAQDLTDGIEVAKQYGPKPKILPRKKAPLRATNSAPNSPQSDRNAAQTLNKSSLVIARTRAATSIDTTKAETNEIQLVVCIGRGRFFEVWQGKWKGKEQVAVKRMKEQFRPTERLQEELAAMKSLHHPNLVRFYSATTRIGEPTCLIVELMEGRSLLDYLRGQGEGKILQLSQLIEKAEQIAAGMAYLEQHNYIHQSLSARNILLTKELKCKVSDYGMLRLLKEVNEEGSVPMSLPKRTAPEAFLYGQFTIKSDVWSYGIVLYEIITYGQLPYLEMTNGEVMQKLQEGYRMPCPENCQEKLYEIMLSCWKEERESRPTFETLRWQMEDYFNTDQEGYLFMKSKRLSIT